MSNFLQTKEIHLTLTNMHTRISTSLTTSSSFSFESITKYLNLTLNQNKTYLLTCFSVPFINDIAYMLSELGITEENEFIVEYEEIDACNKKIEIFDAVDVFEVIDNTILYGNKFGMYRIADNVVEMIYEGNVNEIASNKNEIYITNNKNEILKFDLDVTDESNRKLMDDKQMLDESNRKSMDDKQMLDESNRKSMDDIDRLTKINEKKLSHENVVNKENNEFISVKDCKNECNKVQKEKNVTIKTVKNIKNFRTIEILDEKVRKIYTELNKLYFATLNGNIYEYNPDGNKLLAQNIKEVTAMKKKNNRLYVSSLINSFFYICLTKNTITEIIKNFPATSFVFCNEVAYVSGTTGIAKIIDNEAKTFDVNIRFTDSICIWGDYVVFGGSAGVFVTLNGRLKSKIMLKDEFRGIGAVNNVLYVATKNDICGYTL